MRMRMVCVLVLVAVAAVGQGDAPPSYFDSPGAQRAQARFDGAVAAARAQYEEAIRRARRVYVAELEQARLAAERAGDADEEALLLDEIDWHRAQLAGGEPRVTTLRSTVRATDTQLDPVEVGEVPPNSRVTIVPLEGMWTGGGAKSGVFADWRGYPDARDGWMALHAHFAGKPMRVTKKRFGFVTREGGTLSLYCQDESPLGNSGSIEVEVRIESAVEER